MEALGITKKDWKEPLTAEEREKMILCSPIAHVAKVSLNLDSIFVTCDDSAWGPVNCSAGLLMGTCLFVTAMLIL